MPTGSAQVIDLRPSPELARRGQSLAGTLNTEESRRNSLEVEVQG